MNVQSCLASAYYVPYLPPLLRPGLLIQKHNLHHMLCMPSSQGLRSAWTSTLPFPQYTAVHSGKAVDLCELEHLQISAIYQSVRYISRSVFRIKYLQCFCQGRGSQNWVCFKVLIYWWFVYYYNTILHQLTIQCFNCCLPNAPCLHWGVQWKHSCSPEWWRQLNMTEFSCSATHFIA